MELSAQDQVLIRQIRLLVFDFDGVFTDNAVYVAEDGSETVRCSRSDGLGLSRLRATGHMELLVLSTEENPVVSARCRKLQLPCIQGVADKAARLVELAAERKLPLGQVAYVGNDINDAGCLRQAGLPIVVVDAHPDVFALGRLRTSRPGGHGAVREICDAFSSVLTPSSP